VSPGSGSPTGAPVAASQIRTVPEEVRLTLCGAARRAGGPARRHARRCPAGSFRPPSSLDKTRRRDRLA
jgi:hypothetical protein